MYILYIHDNINSTLGNKISEFEFLTFAFTFILVRRCGFRTAGFLQIPGTHTFLRTIFFGPAILAHTNAILLERTPSAFRARSAHIRIGDVALRQQRLDRWIACRCKSIGLGGVEDEAESSRWVRWLCRGFNRRTVFVVIVEASTVIGRALAAFHCRAGCIGVLAKVFIVHPDEGFSRL